MRRGLLLAPLLLASCAIEPPRPTIGGLTAHLRSTKEVYRLGEAVEFTFEVRNEGAAPVEYVPVHWWDRAYPWHTSKFEEAEAMLVLEAPGRPLPKESTSATG